MPGWGKTLGARANGRLTPWIPLDHPSSKPIGSSVQVLGEDINMKTLICPTCSCSLLRQLSAKKPTWFCPQCHQEFPYSSPVNALSTAQGLVANPALGLGELATASVESRYLTAQECHQFSQSKIQMLEKLNYLKDYFLNAISHELKAPLSHVNLGLQMLAESLKDSDLDREALQTYVQVIQEEFQQEARLVNSLMTLQQVKAGLYATETVSIPLGAWLPTVIQDFDDFAFYKNLKIIFTVPQDLVVQADRDLLGAIVREMLSHAVQVAPRRGTIALAAKLALGRVELQVIHSLPEQSLQKAEEPSDLPFAFQSFYQVPTSEPWLHTDLNIGLILAQNLASSMGGVIWVGQTESQTFWMLEMPDIEAKSQNPTPGDALIGYVAYYMSRGRPVVSPKAGELVFKGDVYGYWGYSSEFYGYWRQLQQRSDFHELGLRGDLYPFGNFLSGRCGIGSCARCQLPVPLLENANPSTPNCPCDDTLLQAHYHYLAEAETPITQILVFDQPPADLQASQALFARNRLNVSFVPGLDSLSPEDLPEQIDLVLLPALNPKENQNLIHRLQDFSQLRNAAFMALSPYAQACTPWLTHTHSLEDYLLTPYGGDYLSRYLQQIRQAQPSLRAPQLHWFPGTL